MFIDLSTARAGPWEQAEQAYDNGDYEQAIRLWRQMANQKDPRAQNQLGEMYSKGRGVRRDFSQAEFWFERSAHQGYSDAQYNLASLHRSGRGVRKDPKKAAKWFLEAAKQGHIKAQYNLGVMYENGWGVDRDSEKAAFWYQKAAAQDYELAAKKLAKLGTTTISAVEKSALPGVEKLRHAARDGNADVVGRLIASGVSVNEADEYGQTALMEAA
ncbi:MAG: sel1 repeat family protein, partial [Gammaproteobacteria bacterium]